MTKHAQSLIRATILTLLLCTAGTAQTSANSTPANSTQSAIADTKTEAAQVKAEVRGLRADLFEQQIARLITEIKASRELVNTQRVHTAALEDLLVAEQKNSASLSISYEFAQRENATRQMAIDSLQSAIQAKSETVAVLTTQRDKERRRAGKANKRLLFTIAAAVAGFVILK